MGMESIITASRPLSVRELHELAPYRQAMRRADGITSSNARAVIAYVRQIQMLARNLDLPSEGGKYNLIAVDGQIFVQWWSNAYIDDLQRKNGDAQPSV